MTSSHLVISAKTLVPNKVRFTDPQGEDVNVSSWGGRKSEDNSVPVCPTPMPGTTKPRVRYRERLRMASFTLAHQSSWLPSVPDHRHHPCSPFILVCLSLLGSLCVCMGFAIVLHTLNTPFFPRFHEFIWTISCCLAWHLIASFLKQS